MEARSHLTGVDGEHPALRACEVKRNLALSLRHCSLNQATNWLCFCDLQNQAIKGDFIDLREGMQCVDPVQRSAWHWIPEPLFLLGPCPHGKVLLLLSPL